LVVGLSFSYFYFLSTKPFAAAILSWRQNRHCFKSLNPDTTIGQIFRRGKQFYFIQILFLMFWNRKLDIAI